MPVYKLTLPDGRKLRLTSDAPPTEEQVAEILRQLPPTSGAGSQSAGGPTADEAPAGSLVGPPRPQRDEGAIMSPESYARGSGDWSFAKPDLMQEPLRAIVDHLFPTRQLTETASKIIGEGPAKFIIPQTPIEWMIFLSTLGPTGLVPQKIATQLAAKYGGRTKNMLGRALARVMSSAAGGTAGGAVEGALEGDVGGGVSKGMAQGVLSGMLGEAVQAPATIKRRLHRSRDESSEVLRRMEDVGLIGQRAPKPTVLKSEAVSHEMPTVHSQIMKEGPLEPPTRGAKYQGAEEIVTEVGPDGVARPTGERGTYSSANGMKQTVDVTDANRYPQRWSDDVSRLQQFFDRYTGRGALDQAQAQYASRFESLAGEMGDRLLPHPWKTVNGRPVPSTFSEIATDLQNMRARGFGDELSAPNDANAIMARRRYNEGVEKFTKALRDANPQVAEGYETMLREYKEDIATAKIFGLAGVMPKGAKLDLPKIRKKYQDPEFLQYLQLAFKDNPQKLKMIEDILFLGQHPRDPGSMGEIAIPRFGASGVDKAWTSIVVPSFGRAVGEVPQYGIPSKVYQQGAQRAIAPIFRDEEEQ